MSLRIDAGGESITIADPVVVSGPIAGFNTLFWSDDFTGTTVDSTKWTVRNESDESNDSSIDLARNVSVANGNLIIQPKRETYTYGTVTRNYTTGYLDTIGKSLAIPKPSYVFCRVKLPLKPNASRGMWPAFWLRLRTGKMEIDVMEAWGTPSDHENTQGHYNFAIWKDTNAGTSAANGYHGFTSAANQDLTLWHTFGAKFDADGTITPYFDHQPVTFTHYVSGVGTTYSKITPAQVPGLAWDPTQDQLGIRLNLQVGQPSYYGDPDANTDFSQQYVVDTVRVYTP